MFDINAIINNAIAQAVEAHTAGINQIYAQRLGEMADKIAALEEENMRQRMNHDKLVERVSDISMWRKAEEASTEIKRSGLDEDRVKEIAKSTVHELWSDVYETEVQDIAERAIDDYDFDDRITHALRDYDFSDAVESVLEDMDWSSKIEDVLEDFDMDSKIENGIDSYDFDFESKIRDVLRNARIDISL